MDECKVMAMLNKEVLESIVDDISRAILIAILFSPSNSIDWNEVYQLIINCKPELVQHDEYKDIQ